MTKYYFHPSQTPNQKVDLALPQKDGPVVNVELTLRTTLNGLLWAEIDAADFGKRGGIACTPFVNFLDCLPLIKGSLGFEDLLNKEAPFWNELGSRFIIVYDDEGIKI